MRRAGRYCGVRAAGTAAPLHIRTPLVYSEPLSRRLGADVHLKMDCLQPPGSFKIRGIGETVRRAVEGGAKCVISSSGGNAGLAAAYAARGLGVPSVIVLPSTTPAEIHDRIRSYDGDVVVHGSVWDEADARAREIAEDKDGAYVHPFDQPSTWEGHATLVEELSQQLPRAPDAIVTCVGGGGLLMGILTGLKAVGWMGSTRVVASETEGAASLAGSLSARRLVTLPAITSVAKSLGAKTVSNTIFNHCLELGPRHVQSFVTTDAAAVGACVQLCADHRVLVEPACGAAIAAVIERCAALSGCKSVVVEVCGGAIVNLDMLNAWVKELGL